MPVLIGNQMLCGPDLCATVFKQQFMAPEDKIIKELESGKHQMDIGVMAQIAALKDLTADLYNSLLQVDRKTFDGKYKERTELWEMHIKEEMIEMVAEARKTENDQRE